MLSEVIFHSTIESSTMPSEFSNFLDELNKRIVAGGHVGCSAIHEEEMINLIQGPFEEMKSLIGYCTSRPEFSDLTIVEWDNIERQDYDSWQVFWDKGVEDTTCQVIDKKAFLRNYVLNKNRMFTPFHQVVKSVFKEPIAN
ncbi:MAG: hypothetical protein KJ941_06105 [Bacteroidetes bacterium]|nr:hypothetical protein [Bacteroidota bacterium]